MDQSNDDNSNAYLVTRHESIELKRYGFFFQIDNQVQSTSVNAADLYGEGEAVPFWLTVKGASVEVGRGSQCDSASVIMAARTPIVDLMDRLTGVR